jgi:hypothetical protein
MVSGRSGKSAGFSWASAGIATAAATVSAASETVFDIVLLPSFVAGLLYRWRSFIAIRRLILTGHTLAQAALPRKRSKAFKTNGLQLLHSRMYPIA